MDTTGVVAAPTDAQLHRFRVGTAGWSLPRQWASAFPSEGSHLSRFAACLSAAEINSSFYRQHRRATYARWAVSVPAGFLFAVKVPRAITHDQRLVAVDVLLDVFLEEARGLGNRFGPLLVQLPPSLAFDAGIAEEFFASVRVRVPGDVVVEPRHESWFTARSTAVLCAHRVTRAAVDPARWPEAARPGGDRELVYYRLHGSPRMYYSDYEEAYLRALATSLAEHRLRGSRCWCVFDNTTLGAAAGNALALDRLLRQAHAHPSLG